MRAELKLWQVSPATYVEVEAKETYQPRKGVTQTGYGPAISSPYMVQYKGRWRRVYVACYGNSGTAYIGRRGNWLATVDFLEAS